MKQKLLLLTFLFFNLHSIQAQTVFFGKAQVENKATEDVLIELRYGTVIKHAISNSKGEYKINVPDKIKEAELVFKYMGYKPISKKVLKVEVSNEQNCNFIEKDITQLEEVVIKQEKIKSTAKKLTYKVNPKDFIANATAPAVFNFVPTLFSTDNPAGDPSVVVDGKLTAKIFIDGIEAIGSEVKNLPVTEIDKVEVINNPSGKYDTDFMGAIVNIVTKKTKEQYLKGNIAGLGYIKNSNWYVSPFLAYKRGILTWKSNYNYRANNGKVDYELSRTDSNGFFNQYNHNNSKGSQQYFSNVIKLDFSKKSMLVIKNGSFGYDFKANAWGYTNSNNTIENFTRTGSDGINTWNNSAVYSYKLTDKTIFYVKGNYDYNSNFNRNSYIYSDNTTSNYDVTSKLNTYSFDLDYEAEEVTFLKKPTGFYTDLKFIQRDFNFSNTNYYLKQQIFDYNAEFDTEWSDKFSTEIAFTIENMQNYNTDFRRNYNYFLPIINLLYHFKNKTDLKIGYSRKILRPSATDLNDAVNVVNPGFAMQGNSNLQSQIRDYYFINLSKTIKATYFGLKLYSEKINNSIVNVYRTDGIYLIQTLDNAAKFNAWGINASIRTKLFKKIDVNLNSGFDYNIYEDKSVNALIKSNKGLTYRGSLSLNTKIIKEKVSLSLTANQNGPNYSLLSKRITYPSVFFSANIVLIKDKLNASLSAGNLMGRFASGFNDISSTNTFYQKISTRNNSTNFGLGLTYYFGKKFNDAIQDNSIQNNDIRN